MRTLWFCAVALVLTAPGTSKAACLIIDEMDAWPEPGGMLPPDGRIVLTGTGLFRDFVEDVRERPPHLISHTGERVPLDVLGHVGAGEEQVVLRPARPLAPDHWYRLDPLRDVPGGPPLVWWSSINEAGPPVWRGTPGVASLVDNRGCPSALYFVLRAPVDSGEDRVRVRVRVRQVRGEDKEEHVFIASARHGVVTVGTVCGRGNLSLERGGTYLVRLEAVNIAGRTRPWKDWFRLEVPAEGEPWRHRLGYEGLIDEAWPEVQNILFVLGFVSLAAIWFTRPMADARSCRRRRRR